MNEFICFCMFMAVIMVACVAEAIWERLEPVIKERSNKSNEFMNDYED